MNEEGVYIAVSTYLAESGWHVVGGQPPSGTDHLPVIEIKDPGHTGKGSNGAFKPDLVACKWRSVLIVEVKPLFSPADRKKLLGILGDQRRLSLLIDELDQRGFSRQLGLAANENQVVLAFTGALGFSGLVGNLHGLVGFNVKPDGSVDQVLSDPPLRVALNVEGNRYV